MKLGVIADDFTGASDIALMISEGGMPTVQYVGIPDRPADPGFSAGVISLKSRTIPARDAVQQSLEACDWLSDQGCEQIIFKFCSTFDSTDDGNIGPVAEALADRLGETSVLVCPAFPENGRTVYQGHLFVHDKLLSESGMQHHPLTPMTDPDIRRVLTRQTSWQIGHVPLSVVDSGAAAILTATSSQSRTMFIVDAVSDADLITIGQAAANRKLVAGGSGIALGLAENLASSQNRSRWNGCSGKAAVLSGSCSNATRQQVSTYQTKAPFRELAAGDIMNGKVEIAEIVDWTMQQDTPPLLFTSADPTIVKEAQRIHGRDESAAAIETLFHKLAAALSEAGVHRIVVAGGETSGAVVSGLKADSLEIGPKIAAGVPALKVSGQPLALALKSGNFGGPDFFSEALEILEKTA
ncbi:3-oxo-tetronate kinase [Roseibium sp.]|uniref:3-oxo-tetronate kinase n=1 Tax=Roseibium sp. TaxID=1936156 RepID=UPI003B51EECD